MDKKEFVNRDIIVENDWFTYYEGYEIADKNIEEDSKDLIIDYILNLFLPSSIFHINYSAYSIMKDLFEVKWTLKINHIKNE